MLAARLRRMAAARLGSGDRLAAVGAHRRRVRQRLGRLPGLDRSGAPNVCKCFGNPGQAATKQRGNQQRNAIAILFRKTPNPETDLQSISRRCIDDRSCRSRGAASIRGTQ